MPAEYDQKLAEAYAAGRRAGIAEMQSAGIITDKGAAPLVGTGSWLGRVGGVLMTLPLYVVLLMAAEITNDPVIYVVFGVSLMLWPCQWAFDLGRSASAPTFLMSRRARAQAQPNPNEKY